MKSKSKLLLASFAVIASVASWSKADVAEEYDRYVDAAIRGSMEIAKQDAYIREMAVFVDRVAAAQSLLGMASDCALHAGYYLASLERVGPPVRANEAPEVESTVEQLFRTSQAINFTRKVLQYLDDHRKVEADLMASASDDSRFRAYSVKNLGLQLLPPPEVGLFDGVYVLYASGEDGKGGGVATLPIIGSIIQIFKNDSQRRQLERAVERLKQNIAHDEHYQRFAREACEDVLKTHGKRTFDDHRRLTESLRNTFAKVDVGALEGRVGGLKRMLAEYEDAVVKKLASRARELAENELRDVRARLQQQRTRSELYGRITLNYLRLERQDLRAGLELVDDIEADLALLGLDTSGTEDVEGYIGKTRARIDAWRSRPRERRR